MHYLWNRPLNQSCFLTEKQAAILLKDLNAFTLGDFLRHFPFRYEDRSRIYSVREIHDADGSAVQVKVVLSRLEFLGSGKSYRLCGTFQDESGSMEVVWFKKPDMIAKFLKIGATYLLYGKAGLYMGKPQLSHPEMEIYRPEITRAALEPVYNSSERMKRAGMDSKGLNRLIIRNLEARKSELTEPFPEHFIQENRLMPLPEAIFELHRPRSLSSLAKARERLKIEELFPLQFFLQRKRLTDKTSKQGYPLPKLDSFNRFYQHHLPFSLTNAQKRVLKEIRSESR